METLPLQYDIFISYSHKDGQYLEQIISHLKNVDLHYWFDGHIKTGDEWNDEIKYAIEHSQVIIVLISANFVNSEFIQNNEMPLITTRYNKNKKCIYPILLKQCNYEYKYEWLSNLQYYKNNSALCDKDYQLVQNENTIKHSDLKNIANEIRNKFIIAHTQKHHSNHNEEKTHSDSPSSPDINILPLLINRNDQIDKMHDVVNNHPSDNRFKKPILFVLHGDENQCLEQFITAIEKKRWEHIYAKDKGVSFKSIQFVWTSSLINNKQRLQKINKTLKNNFDELNDPSQSALEKLDMLCNKQPILLYCLFDTNFWLTYPNNQLLHNFIDLFTTHWPPMDSKYPLIVCMFLIYRTPKLSFWKRLLHSKKYARINETIKQYLCSEFGICDPNTSHSLQVIQEFGNVTKLQMDQWVLDYKDQLKQFIDTRKITNLIFCNHTELPMDDVIDKLDNKIFNPNHPIEN